MTCIFGESSIMPDRHGWANQPMALSVLLSRPRPGTAAEIPLRMETMETVETKVWKLHKNKRKPWKPEKLKKKERFFSDNFTVSMVSVCFCAVSILWFPRFPRFAPQPEPQPTPCASSPSPDQTPRLRMDMSRQPC